MFENLKKFYYKSKSWIVPFSSKQFFFNFFKSPNRWLALFCHAPNFGQYAKIFWSKNLIKFRLQNNSKFSIRIELLWLDRLWSKKILNFLKFSNSSSIRWNSSASISASPSLKFLLYAGSKVVYLWFLLSHFLLHNIMLRNIKSCLKTIKASNNQRPFIFCIAFSSFQVMNWIIYHFW